MPAIEIVGGACLGVALGLLQDAIKKANDRTSTTRYILDRLDATVVMITPWVKQVDNLTSEEVDDSSRKSIEAFKHILEEVVSSVKAYGETSRRNFIKKYRYKRRIRELEASFKWMVDVDFQVSQFADIKEIMAKMSELTTKLDESMRKPTDSPCFRKNHGISQVTKHTKAEATNQSSVGNDASSSDGSKPRIDIHLQWTSRKRNKDHEIRFTLK